MMQAGRELDKQIAVGLGWKVDDHMDIYVNGEIWEKIPQFSTTWEGMGVLVEEAMKRGFAFRIETRFMDGIFFDYQCVVGDGSMIESATGTTAPQTLCLAFLKAKGIPI